MSSITPDVTESRFNSLEEGSGTRITNKGKTASAAVATSTMSISCIGRNTKRTAPIAGAAILARPCRAWYIPFTRERCSLGTIKDADACNAGHWKLPRVERTAITANTWMNSTRPIVQSEARTTIARADSVSETIITRRRLHRSTSAPAKGLTKI